MWHCVRAEGKTVNQSDAAKAVKAMHSMTSHQLRTLLRRKRKSELMCARKMQIWDDKAPQSSSLRHSLARLDHTSIDEQTHKVWETKIQNMFTQNLGISKSGQVKIWGN